MYVIYDIENSVSLVWIMYQPGARVAYSELVRRPARMSFLLPTASMMALKTTSADTQEIPQTRSTAFPTYRIVKMKNKQ